MTDQYILKYKYLVYKLYPKFNHNSLYINVDTKSMFSSILSPQRLITSSTFYYTSLCPLPFVLDRSILNPTSNKDYLLILTLFPFVLLQIFILDRSDYNQIYLERMVEVVDLYYHEERINVITSFLVNIYEQPLDSPYYRSLGVLFPTFYKLREQYTTYNELYNYIKEKLNHEYDFY